MTPQSEKRVCGSHGVNASFVDQGNIKHKDSGSPDNVEDREVPSKQLSDCEKQALVYKKMIFIFSAG